MVHPDKRKNIPVKSDNCTNQSIEELEQLRYETKSPSNYNENKGVKSTLPMMGVKE